MTIDDFIALVDLVLSPKFTMEAAEKRLGKVTSWVSKTRGNVQSSDPELHNTTIAVRAVEVRGPKYIATFAPVVLAVQTQPTKPIIAPWDRLTKALGPAKPGEPVLDALGGPKPYNFKPRVGGVEGDLSLFVNEVKGKPPEIVDINLYRNPP